MRRSSDWEGGARLGVPARGIFQSVRYRSLRIEVTSSPLQATNSRTRAGDRDLVLRFAVEGVLVVAALGSRDGGTPRQAPGGVNFGSFFAGGHVGVGPIERQRPKATRTTRSRSPSAFRSSVWVTSRGDDAKGGLVFETTLSATQFAMDSLSRDARHG
jgi:hypothetical protein